MDVYMTNLKYSLTMKKLALAAAIIFLLIIAIFVTIFFIFYFYNVTISFNNQNTGDIKEDQSATTKSPNAEELGSNFQALTESNSTELINIASSTTEAPKKEGTKSGYSTENKTTTSKPEIVSNSEKIITTEPVESVFSTTKKTVEEPEISSKIPDEIGTTEIVKKPDYSIENKTTTSKPITVFENKTSVESDLSVGTENISWSKPSLDFPSNVIANFSLKDFQDTCNSLRYDYERWIGTGALTKIINTWRQNFRKQLAKTFDKMFSAKNMNYNTDNQQVIDCIELLGKNFQFEANLKICLKEMYKLLDDGYYKNLQTSIYGYVQRCKRGDTTAANELKQFRKDFTTELHILYNKKLVTTSITECVGKYIYLANPLCPSEMRIFQKEKSV